MGMFDTVIISCPECGNEVEFQSKAGESILEEYRNPNIPINIAYSLHNEQEQCRNCGKIIELQFPENVPLHTHLLVK